MQAHTGLVRKDRRKSDVCKEERRGKNKVCIKRLFGEFGETENKKA